MKESKVAYHRNVMMYDPIIGYRFIPNIYSKVYRSKHSFSIETNPQGFRSSFSYAEMGEDKPRVLALGDSYLAGDGISNEDRFLDLLAKKLDFHPINTGLPGSGTDQQLLIQEKIAKDWEYDILVFMPFLHDLERNLTSKVHFVDWASRKRLDMRKPYFRMDDTKNTLELLGCPVEKSNKYILNENLDDIDKNNHLGNTVRRFKGLLQEKVPFLHDILKNHVAGKYHTFMHRSGLRTSDVMYANGSSYGWKLMKALMLRMINNAGNKPVIIVPIPLASHVLYHAKPNYIDRFKEISRDNVQIIDILPEFKKLTKKRRENIYIPNCGHFTPEANEFMADICKPYFENAIRKIVRTGMKRDDISEKPEEGLRLALNTSKKRIGKYILGVSCYYHDSAAALLCDGEIIAAAQEERFTRVKHDKSFPINAIEYCLEEARINGSDLSGVVYYDNDEITLERILTNQLYLGRKEQYSWVQSVKSWVDLKSQIWSDLRSFLRYDGPLYRNSHHRSHAASAFYPSPYEEAAIIVADGVGEWSTTTLSKGEGNKIDFLYEQKYPHSLGLLYSSFTAFCGFKVNSGEYKLMGLAPYGKPEYVDLIFKELIDLKEDGSFRLNLDFFDFLKGRKMTNEKFASLFGGPGRTPESRITKRETDIASSIQAVTEEIMLRTARFAFDQTGKKALILAGGVALNCVANGKILRESPFESIWIQPAAGDAGGALGAALDLWYGSWGNERRVGDTATTTQGDSCFGPKFSDDEVKAFLDWHNYPYHKLEKTERASRITDHLLKGEIVGHFSGRMEFGPRALGNRSILGDPRRMDIQSVMNLKIKFRESFRPFAPIVMEEDASTYFDINQSSPYMLLVASVAENLQIENETIGGEDLLVRLKQQRSAIPAVTHIDYSARIQTVSRDRYPEIYEILDEFKKKTSCSVLVNTSFNVRGEPIVCTPSDAYRCFMRTDMDVLVINNFLLLKTEQPEWHEKENWMDQYGLD